MADNDDKDYRPTEPVMVYEPHAGQQLPDPPAEQEPPERTWKDHPLLWICVVVAVFMAVPFFANRATRAPVAAKPALQASAPSVDDEPPTAESTAPQPEAPRTATPRSTPVPARAAPDPTRQMVTKCVERGRVVYTQTGECAGSVSAVPIDTSKNVVGPGRENTRP